MKPLGVIFLVTDIDKFIREYRDRIEELSQKTLIGKLTDGSEFRIFRVVEHDWAISLIGVEFKDYVVVGDASKFIDPDGEKYLKAQVAKHERPEVTFQTKDKHGLSNPQVWLSTAWVNSKNKKRYTVIAVSWQADTGEWMFIYAQDGAPNKPMFTRSWGSFLGTNRFGAPRFVQV